MEFNQKDLGKIQESFTIKASLNKNPAILTESSSGEEYILPRIEAIHAGSTRNYNHYLAEKLKGDANLKSGVYSWTHPFNKPVIYNHDVDTKATGRVISAAYTDYTSAGKPGIIIVPKITDPEAIQAIKDGRLLTVSVGARTDSIICSITGKDIMKEGFTGYEKGEYYNGKLCEWIIGDVWFEEVSWVNTPADENAFITDIQTPIFVGDETEESVSTVSANYSLQEYFGVPKGISIFVPKLQEGIDLKNINAENAENVEQEDKLAMELAENEIVKEEEVEKEEESTAVSNDTNLNDEEADKDDENTETSDEEATKLAKQALSDAKIELNKTTTDEEKASEKAVETTKEETKVVPEVNSETKENNQVTQLLVENAGLKAQIKKLTDELKEHYVSNILSFKKLSEEKATAYAARLKERSLNSLKDTLTDIKEEESIQEESKVQTIIKSPVSTTENKKTSETTLTEKEKIDMLTAMLKY